jgi:hypothetical protein
MTQEEFLEASKNWTPEQNESFKETLQTSMKTAAPETRKKFGKAVWDQKYNEYWAGNPGLMSIQNSHTPKNCGGSEYGRFKMKVNQDIREGMEDGTINFKQDYRRNDPTFNTQFGTYVTRQVYDPVTGRSIKKPDGTHFEYGDPIPSGAIDITGRNREESLGDKAIDSRAPDGNGGYAPWVSTQTKTRGNFQNIYNNTVQEPTFSQPQTPEYVAPPGVSTPPPNDMTSWTPQDWENYWSDGASEEGMMAPTPTNPVTGTYTQTTADSMGVDVATLISWAERNPNHPAAQRILTEMSS